LSSYANVRKRRDELSEVSTGLLVTTDNLNIGYEKIRNNVIPKI
jgi:hypothetical protein